MERMPSRLGWKPPMKLGACYKWLARTITLEPPMSIRYELIIYWSDVDQSFVVEVPELPGCMADGETYEQAVANAQRVIKEWIDRARELGRPVPEPRGRLKYA